MFWFSPIISAAAAVVAASGVVVYIKHPVTLNDIKSKLMEVVFKLFMKYKFKKDLKCKIMKAKEHSIPVGIFDNNELLETVEISSPKGLSEDVLNAEGKEFIIDIKSIAKKGIDKIKSSYAFSENAVKEKISKTIPAIGVF